MADINESMKLAIRFIPAVVWAVLWVVIAVLLIGGAIWVAWVRPARRSSP